MTEAAAHNVEVIVVGGGPAGSTAALKLASRGRRVLVLEKAIFPRFHVGESLLPYNREIFEELGLAGVLAECGFMEKRAAQFWSGSGTPGARLEFARGRFTEHASAFQVERAVFDEVLLKRAEAVGAEVWQGATFLGHEAVAEGVAVRCRDASGVERRVVGRFLMDASGMAAVTARQSGQRRPREGHRKVAIFAHFEGVEMPSGEEKGDLLLLVRDRAWVWMIPLSAGRTSVGLVMDQSEYVAGRQDREALWARIVAETPELARRMRVAERVGGLHVEADYSFGVDRMVEPGLVRIGDAAGFLDPVFSSGVMLAMESGRDAAVAVEAALAEGVLVSRGLRRYERELRRHMEQFWCFVEGFYTRPFIELFLQPQKELDVISGVNAVLAGRARLPFAARWRLWVFFGLVKLQRWIPVVPRLRWRDGFPPVRAAPDTRVRAALPSTKAEAV